MKRLVRSVCLGGFVALLVVADAPRPLHAQSSLEAIVARVRAADVDGALALLKALPEAEAGDAELRYLTARLHEKRGRLQDALAALPTTLDTLPPEVIVDVKTRRARWLAKLERCAEAKPVFGELLATPNAASDTALVLAAAECALASKDTKSSLAYLDKLPDAIEQTVPPQLLRARALVARGERKEAIAVLRDVCLNKPGHSRSAEALRMLERLVPKHGFTDEERMTRASALIDALRPNDAIAELDRMRAPKTKSVRARALHLRGMALFQMRTRYAEAAKVLDLAAKQGGPDAASDAYHAARALARADRDAEAVVALRAFAKRFPNSTFVTEALHTAAWLELRHGMPGGEANMRAQLAAIEKKGDREALQNALWELAYHYFDRGQYAEAQPLFDRYAGTTDVTMVRARGLYWAGRSAWLTGHRDVAIARFQETLRAEPLHWYHLLARLRLIELGQAVADPFEAAAPPTAAMGTATATALPLPAVVSFYRKLGLYDDALTALRNSETAMRQGAAQGDGLLALIATYHGLDEHARPYRLVEREGMGVLSMRPDGAARPYWEALFPRPYRQHVVQASTQEQLPEDFVYSIMRKESAYDPSVVSSADAMGLLQLIEPTARTMARSVGIPGFTRAKLFVPETNIRLGAHYLSRLRTLYKGQYVPAIAAYNAGEHRVNAWLARANKRFEGGIELDRFVEEIPIEQTRNYVRRVVANWVRYRYLQDPATWHLELPARLSL